jgi:hypothetical protein
MLSNRVRRLTVPVSDAAGEVWAVSQFLYERGRTDGLPVIPPTEPLVLEMLEHTDRAADEVVGYVEPSQAGATVEAVAINAVMAGCRPEYLPVVLAAVEAIGEPAFNLFGIQATTNPVAPLIIVNGPLATALEINARGNCFGQGFMANATIGRALRFVLLNIGGGTPQTLDKATQGQPAKFGFCVAENEAESPWEPLHVERGYPAEASTVTVISVTGTQNILDMASRSARGLLQMFCSHAGTAGVQNVLLGGGPLFAISPEHAQILARDGFTKQDVRQYLYEHARAPLTEFSRENIAEVLAKRRPRWCVPENPDARIPIADRPEDITIIVAGGPGPHSQFLPSFGQTEPVTRTISVHSKGGS